MSKKTNNEVLLGGFIVVAGGLLAYMSFAVGGLSVTPGEHVSARFTNAGGLVKDAVVSVAGVQVGHIERLEVDHDHAIVHFFVRTDAKIRKDVQATIRAKSLLGEKYLELEPQSRDGALIADGDEISITHPSVEVDEVLAALGPVIKNVDPQDIATIIHVAAKTLKGNNGDLSDLVKHANSIASQVDTIVKHNHANIDLAAASLASLSAQGDSLLKSKRAAIDRTVVHIDHMAGVWDDKSPALLDKGNRIADHVNSIVAEAHRQVPGMLRDAKRTLGHADTALVRVPGALDDLHGLKRGVDASLAKVNPLLDKANAITPGQLEDFAHKTLARDGIRVYLHPFGPSETDYTKNREADDAGKSGATPTASASH